MKRHRGSIFWSLVLISIGVLFLLSNLNVEIRPWLVVARYWPVLIIFWGLSKLLSYFSSEEDSVVTGRSSLTGGDIVLLIFLLILGTAISKVVGFDFVSWPKDSLGIDIGDPDIEIFGEPKNTFTFIEEASQPLTKKDGVLEILNKYGSVDINTHNLPAVRIRVEKKIKAREESKAKELAAALRIRINSKPQGYTISTNRDEFDKEKTQNIQTNLSIWVPKSTQLAVSNKYGTVSLSGVSGYHTLANGYGATKVSNVDGGLHIENQYGSINVTNLTGQCEVTNKYGSIELDSIGGKTQIENGYGSIVLKKIRGPIQLIHKYGKVDCVDLDSTLNVDGRYVEIRGVNIGGDVQIITSYKNVDLENVQGAMTIQGKHGDINIKDVQPPSKPIKVESEYSAVTITLPRNSRFQFDAYSKYGKLVSEFESLGGATSSEFGSRIKGSHGQGGPLITVNTSYRDISLNAS